MITVQPVTNKKQLAAFIDFPHDLYKGDPNYVPELHIAQRDLLTPGQASFSRAFVYAELFLPTMTKGKIVKGRIAAIQNNNHNNFNKANDGSLVFLMR
jgi:hypothetical protein